ncbi:hypothetical protein IKF03_00795 [Candidatus Saccharibacteria bacterium]|nr:hypothetical protein [Candidatus Saccharibacteria bacterium]
MKKVKVADKISFGVFLIIFGLSVVALINSLVLLNWFKISMASVALVLYFIPFLAQKFLKIQLSTILKIVYFLFIFAALILGEVFAFYGPFPFWDIVLHVLSGFVLAGIGFSLIEIVARGKQPRGLMLLFAFCFSVTAGILWECVEFSFDMMVRTDAQKDAHVRQISTITLQRDGGNQPVKLNDIEKTEIYLADGEIVTIEDGFLDIGLMDTMKDIFVNFAGAGMFIVVGAVWTKGKLKFITST